MSERRQWKQFASSFSEAKNIGRGAGHTVLRDERDFFPDEPGYPVTIIEGHAPVYTREDLLAAIQVGQACPNENALDLLDKVTEAL